MQTLISESLLAGQSMEDKVNYYLLYLMQRDADFMVELRRLQCICKSTYDISAEEVQKVVGKWIALGCIKQVVVGATAYLIIND